MSFLRAWRAALVAVIATGCATGPVSFVSLTPRLAGDTYSCALRKVNELGYTVSNTNKDAGFITGTKQTSGLGTMILTGSQFHDQLTVSIFDAPGGNGRSIRATAGRVDQKSNVFGTSSTATAPTTAGKADANALLRACSDGTITQQGDGTFLAAASSQ